MATTPNGDRGLYISGCGLCTSDDNTMRAHTNTHPHTHTDIYISVAFLMIMLNEFDVNLQFYL